MAKRKAPSPFRRFNRTPEVIRLVVTLQKFSSVHASFHNPFNQERHLTDRETFKANRSVARAEWMMFAS